MDALNIFVASASEVADVARAFKETLEEENDVVVTAWPSQFSPGRTPVLDNLLRAVGAAQYGIFILAPTDRTRMSADGADTLTPRDNVIFELGLFVGMHGRDHAYLVYPGVDPGVPQRFWLPSDFRGPLHGSEVRWQRVERVLESDAGQDHEAGLKDAVANVCASAKARFHDVARKDKSEPQRADAQTAAPQWSGRFGRLAASSIEAGAVVLHPLFGLGKVVEQQSIDERDYVLVSFRDGDRRIPLGEALFDPFRRG